MIKAWIALLCVNFCQNFAFAKKNDTSQVNVEYIIGGARPARLVLPRGYETLQELPLVVSMHGYTSSSKQLDEFYDLSASQSQYKFAMILPDGRRDMWGLPFWDAIPYCCGTKKDREKSQDVKYLHSLVLEAREKFSNISESKTVLFGHSNGAMMTYRMACSYPGSFTDIVSLAGTLDTDSNDCKLPNNKLNVLHVHGTSDAVIQFKGVNNTYTSAPQTLQRVVDHFQCKPPTVTEAEIKVAKNSKGNDTDVTRWENCNLESKVEFWKVNKAPHMPQLASGVVARIMEYVGIPLSGQ